MNVTKFSKRRPRRLCNACDHVVPLDDELCPGCGYYLATWHGGPAVAAAAVCSETDRLIEAFVELDDGVVRRARDLAEVFRTVVPAGYAVHGWWDYAGEAMLVLWQGDDGWAAASAPPGSPAAELWHDDPLEATFKALASVAGPFDTLYELAWTAAVDELGGLGGFSDETTGALLWGILCLLPDVDVDRLAKEVAVSSSLIRGRRTNSVATATQLP